MSSAVLTTTGTPEGQAPSFGRFILRRPDFVVLALALPVFIAAGFPIAAWAVVTAVWIAQFALQVYLDHRVATADDPKKVIGLLAGGALGRAWFVATALMVTGLIDRDTGVYAIVLTLVVFTAYFIARVMGRLFEESEAVRSAGE